MSSKVRKPGPSSRLQNRPSNRGSRQSSAQSFGRSHSKEYANAAGGQNQDFFASEFSNSNVTASVISLVGCHVLVQTLNEQVYDGILNTVSPSFVICLTNAHLQSCATQKRQDQCNAPNRDEIIPEISFDLRQIISIKCKNVDLDFARKDLFQTDSMISGSNGLSTTERELKPWLPDKDDIQLASLEDMHDIKNGVNYDELKKANEKRFNFTSAFTEETMSKYMDDIETEDKEVYLQREREAKRIAEEIEKEASHRYHDSLDSGVTEEEKFSSVKRSGFNSSANRNSNPSSRGRGRSRAPGFSNYREPSNEPIPDSKFNKNPAGTSKRVGSNDETGSSQVRQLSYSQLVQRSTQQDHVNQHGGQNNEVHSQHAIPYQPPPVIQQQQRQRMQNDASLPQQQKMMPNQNNANYNLPPRLQQQQQQKFMNMETTISKQQQQPEPQVAPKPRFEAQPIVVSAAAPAVEQRSVSLDNEKEVKKNRDVLVNSAKGGSLDKTNLEASADLKITISNDLAKGSGEMSKHVEEVLKDAKAVPRQKFGKQVVQQHEEKTPDIDDLKNFGEKFKLSDKSQKRLKKTPEPSRGQPKETEKTDSDSLIIPVSPDPPVKEAVERLPQVQKIAIKDENTENKDVAKSDKEEKETLVSKSDVSQPDQKTNKVEEEKHETEAASSQASTPAVTKGLNPNAKEFKLNPNAIEFVPPTPQPALPTTVQAHVQNMPTAPQYQPPRMIAASSPPVLQGHYQQIPVIQTQGPNRYAKGYPVDHVIDSPSVSTPSIHQGYIQQPQQQPAMQHQQQQQSPVVFVQYQTPLVTTIPQQHGIGRPQWHQPQSHVGHTPQLMTQDGNPGVIIVNPPVSHIMAHQQQSQSMHAQHIAYSHPATQQVQQPIQYVVPQHYSQIASPLNSNVQATPVLHGIQRPPTPSQHPVHSATPPMHPGQQMFYGANQMTGINMQPQTTFVATPRGQLQMQTYQ